MNISIAIPNTSLADCLTKLEKSRKISLIARACGIFKINTIYIYNEGGYKQDQNLLVTILRYINTPPFLRKRLFSKINSLKYAGVLTPLKIPSHTVTTNPKKIKMGDIRDGVVISVKGKKYIDVGIEQFIPYYGKSGIGKKITIQFKNGHPDFQIKDIQREQIQEYWGYNVKEKGNLFSLISSWPGKIILTSRRGKTVSSQQIKGYLDLNSSILLVFGSPNKGVYEILGGRIKQIQNAKIINFFPKQATETVRLEEAILGALSILNVCQNSSTNINNFF